MTDFQQRPALLKCGLSLDNLIYIDLGFWAVHEFFTVLGTCRRVTEDVVRLGYVPEYLIDLVLHIIGEATTEITIGMIKLGQLVIGTPHCRTVALMINSE